MQKITPHLWYDKEAKEAAALYISLFKDSKIKSVTTLHNTPSGSVDSLTVDLCGQEFAMISAGPFFTFTPALSLLVNCESKEEVDALWAELSKGGSVLMGLGTYPFSEYYGWLQDKYGLSWQLMFVGGRNFTQKIVPSMLFVGDVCGKTEEAIKFYASIFPDSRIGDVMRYTKGEEPDQEGSVKHATFTLAGQEFTAMDSAHKHNFTFNEAISFIVHCDTQEEIDAYWNKLSAYPKSEECGWLKDKFGLSWQIVPTVMDEMMRNGTQEQIDRVTKAFLAMKKFDVAELTRAYEGK